MRCLTLHEPYATFISLGLKRYETRGWAAGFTGPIAIHAGKKTEFAAQALIRDPFRSLLGQHGICRLRDFRFGHVICVAFLLGCHPTESLRDDISDIERDLGNFNDGRSAWELGLVHRLSHPVEARGHQQIWHWKPDEQMESELREWCKAATGLGKAVSR